MKTNIVKYYRKSDESSLYSMGNKKRVTEFEKTYGQNRQFFGKNVLDIACGGGILGFIIERNGHKYTGIDINPDMISDAKSYAKDTKSKNKFILADATKRKIKGTFDTITFLGNALCHINTHQLLQLMQNLNYRKGSFFIVDYRDVVRLLYNKKWRKHKTNRGIITEPLGCDTKNGEILNVTYNPGGKNKVRFNHTIWSPFILEPIMNSLGWKLLKRRELKRWEGWFDIYRKL